MRRVTYPPASHHTSTALPSSVATSSTLTSSAMASTGNVQTEITQLVSSSSSAIPVSTQPMASMVTEQQPEAGTRKRKKSTDPGSRAGYETPPSSSNSASSSSVFGGFPPASGPGQCTVSVPVASNATPQAIVPVPAIPAAQIDTFTATIAATIQHIHDYPTFEKAILKAHANASVPVSVVELTYILTNAAIQAWRARPFPGNIAEAVTAARRDYEILCSTPLNGKEPDDDKCDIAEARVRALSAVARYAEQYSYVVEHRSQLAHEKERYNFLLHIIREHTTTLITRAESNAALSRLVHKAFDDEFIADKDGVIAAFDNNPANANEAAIILTLYAALHHLGQTPPTQTDHERTIMRVEDRKVNPARLVRQQIALRDLPNMLYIPVTSSLSLIASDADALYGFAHADRLAAGSTGEVRLYAEMRAAAKAAAATAHASKHNAADISAAARAAARKLVDHPRADITADVHARNANAGFAFDKPYKSWSTSAATTSNPPAISSSSSSLSGARPAIPPTVSSTTTSSLLATSSSSSSLSSTRPAVPPTAIPPASNGGN